MVDEDRLAGYVDVWWSSIEDVAALLDGLEPDHWRLPTDLPGWNVHAVAAHLSHMESVAAGMPQTRIDVDPGPHVRSAMGRFTEEGVLARRDLPPDELITELRTATSIRRDRLTAHPPSEPTAPAQPPFDSLGWDVETLLRNRPIDVWMHEQDIRRAVDRRGNLDSPAGDHTVASFMGAFGFVLARRAEAPAGTTLVVRITDQPGVAFAVSDDGRGRRSRELPEVADVELTLSREALIILAGGRRELDEVADLVQIEGDRALGQRILSRLAVTP